MKKLLVSLGVASLLSVCTYSIDAHDRNQHRDNKRELMADLFLSQQQKEDIKQIHVETKQDLRIYRAEQKKFRESMRALIQADIWDKMAVTSAIQQQMEVTLQTRLIRAKSENNVFNQLTATQQEQLITGRYARKNQQRDRNPERKIQHLVKVLALGSDQQALLMVMMTSEKEHREAYKKEAIVDKAEFASILYAKQFDTRAWLAANAESKQQRLDMALNKAKSRFDILSVLNAQQRKKFNNIMKKSKRENRSKKRIEGFNEALYLSS